MTSDHPARDLNPEQHAAVTHGDGPQLVLAGAGSGKTRVITQRIAWLVQERGVDPSRIVAVTFTNKAAREMQDRVERLLGGSLSSAFVGTFHRFSLKLLRRWGERIDLSRHFTILDRGEQISLMKRALEAEELAESSFPPRTMLAAISSAKSRLVDASRYEREADGFFERRVARVYHRYQGFLVDAGAVDFDDMIALAVRLLESDPELRTRVRDHLEHLLVDEFQDTNHAQLALVRQLATESGNLTAVGDEDQGIYRWRGAELENILEFERHFPGAVVRKLERNYRSTQTILDASGALVANNRNRRGKALWTESGDGEPIVLYRAGDEGDEARWLVRAVEGFRGRYRLGDQAVLLRTNAQTRVIEEELRRRAIPYTLVAGTRFYDRAEIKDLLAYLRLLRNPRDGLSFDRVLNQPPRGIGDTTRGFLEELATDLGQPPWDVLAQDELGGLPARSAKALRGFRDVVLELQTARELPLPDLMERVLEVAGFEGHFDRADPEQLSRWENLRELVSAARQFVEDHGPSADLEAFLDHVALVADVDSLDEDDSLKVMTLHAAKGLEFPVVFVTGIEDGLLPHFNASDTREEIEEERRLLYVGMTRARERLLLSGCRRRRIAGRFQDQEPSPFLVEIPERFLDVQESPDLFRSSPTGQRVTSFFDLGSSRRTSPPPAATRRVPVEESSGPGELRRGIQVRHPTLGRGRILDFDGAGDHQKITVFFDRAGKKVLLARFAKLEPE